MLSVNVPLDPNRTGSQAETLEQDLRKLVIGQDEAIREIVSVYQTHVAGMSAPGRPVANLMFLGPTGTGKTRIVEALAEVLVKNPKAVIKIDCAEFQHSHEIAKIIGSPPGYLGHRETHPMLSQDNLNQYHTPTVKLSFVLFDEIEKASDGLWNLLLGILDKATLTTGDNRKVDFSRAMIFMTSNLGAAQMEALTRKRMGLPGMPVPKDTAEGKRSDIAEKAARKKFTPEFINRLDKMITFKPLGKAELRAILDIELEAVQQRIYSRATLFYFVVGEPAKELLLREGVSDPRYGARHLKRAIERLLVQPLSNLIASHQVRGCDRLEIGVDEPGAALTFTRTAENVSLISKAA